MAGRKHPGTIERRGDGLRVTLYAGGRRYRFTLPTTDRRVAVEFARRKDLELQRQQARRDVSTLLGARMSDLLDKFAADRVPLRAPKTQAVYGLSLAAFRAFFCTRLGDPLVEAVHSGMVEEFLTWRSRHRQHRGTWQETPVQARTVQKDRTVLHGLFAFAARLRWREGNPVAETAAPKVDERSPVILTDRQYADLLAAAGDRPELRLYILLLGETGARCESEALWLRWEDVDLETGFLAIVSGRDGHRTKSGRSRLVPMTGSLRAALREHFARYRFMAYRGQPSPWIFHHDRDHRRARAGERIGSLRYAFRAAARRAGLPANFRQHDLRHRRVTSWLAAGKGLSLVQEAMGHSSPTVTERYKHLVPEHLRALVDDLPEHRPTGRPMAG